MNWSPLISLSTCCLLLASAVHGGTPTGLRDLASFYGFPAPVENSKNVTLKSAFSTLTFEENSRKLFFNSTLLYMNGPMLAKSGDWTLRECDVANVLDPLLRRNVTLSASRCRLVVLDPGHGGNDKGTVGRRGVEEKQIVLDVARRAAKKLEACGVTVRLTRDRDRFIELADRSRFAAKLGADVFVSIHANASADRAVSGVETFIPPAPGFPSTSASEVKPADAVMCIGNKHDAANTILGYYLQKSLVASTKGGDRGLKRARYQVIRDAPCPAALAECGFVSNALEEERMLKKEYRDHLADGLARGILTYVHSVNEANYASRGSPQ